MKVAARRVKKPPLRTQARTKRRIPPQYLIQKMEASLEAARQRANLNNTVVVKANRVEGGDVCGKCGQRQMPRWRVASAEQARSCQNCGHVEEKPNVVAT